MSLCGAKWRRAPPRAGLYADPAVQVLVGLARLTRQAGEPEQEPGKGLRLSLPPELVGLGPRDSALGAPVVVLQN